MKNKKILVFLIVLAVGFFVFSLIPSPSPNEKLYEEDIYEPYSQIVSPPSGSWHYGDFQIEVMDEDLHSGIKEDSCQYKVLSYTPSGEEVSSGWKSRKCNSVQTISVGPEGDCCFEGKDCCWIYVRSQDNAGNWYTPSMQELSIRYYSINWTKPYTGESDIEQEETKTAKPSDAETEIWASTWGGLNSDIGRSLWSDRDYLYALGSTESFGAGSYDFALVKWSMNGDVVWNVTWGGLNSDIGRSLWSDGNYLYALGGTNSFGAGSCDFALVKWDMDGSVVWNVTWGGAEYEAGYSLWRVGSYFYAFGSAQNSLSNSDVVLLKWTMDGSTVMWSRTWGVWGRDSGYSLWGDGTYLYTLGLAESLSRSVDFTLEKWDVNGNLIWSRTWGGLSYDGGYSLWGNGGYLYTLGETDSFGSGSYDFALVKWDMDGNIVGNYIWGGLSSDFGRSLWGDETYLYALGSTISFGAGSCDFALIKIETSSLLNNPGNINLNNPNDISYEEGSTGHNIVWVASDDDPNYYTICKNGLEVQSDTWTSENPIAISADGLSLGTYNYTVTVWDMSGNSASDTVIVQVTDKTSNEAGIDFKWSFEGSLVVGITAVAIIGTVIIVGIIYKKNQ